jgi:hypothetical protein
LPGSSRPSLPTVQYGVRVETGGPRRGLTYNGAVDSAFGRRTDFLPNRSRVLPMVGFSWPVLSELRLDDGAVLGRRGTVSGGIRRYSGALTTRSVESYARQTGLPAASAEVECVGPATPPPNWRSFQASSQSIPVECADGGTGGSPLAQAASPVAVFSPTYRVWDSWRPTVSMSFALDPQIRITGTATLSENRNIPDPFDLNFDRTVRFTLPPELDRPVFVSPASIIPASGAVAWQGSRVIPIFSHVIETRTDLRSSMHTFGASINHAPVFAVRGGSASFATASYQYSTGIETGRGFSSTTAGDPTDLIRSRLPTAAHVATVALSHSWAGWGTLGVQARIQSGIPFTPIVTGDINGDGYSTNDRAFVFDPSVVQDTALKRAMQRLLSEAPGNARRCLSRQIGTVASRNSCVGPWSAPLLNASIAPDAYRFGFGGRGSFQLLFTNILSGVDQLLHALSGIRGWGQLGFADPTLLTVRGFDAQKRQFDIRSIHSSAIPRSIEVFSISLHDHARRASGRRTRPRDAVFAVVASLGDRDSAE